MLPLFIFLLLSSVCGYSAWNGQYTMTTTATINNNQGRINAFVSWSWNQQMMKLSFGPNVNSPRWSETYQYNKDNRGWTQAPTTQWLFSFGTTCNPSCASSGWQKAMPPFDTDLSSTFLNPFTPINTGGSCNAVRRYTPKTGAWSHSVVSFDTSAAGVVCNFVLTDGRTFDLIPNTFVTSAPTITIPSGCSCNQAIDIMFLIDRSSSISGSEMTQFRNFVTNFLKGLTIAPDAVWVGMAHFSTYNGWGTTFEVSSSNTTVYAGLNQWLSQCPTSGSKTSSCYLSATCPSAGMINAAARLFERGTREVPKLIVTLTDGGQNQRANGQSCNGLTSNCDADIALAMDYAKSFQTPTKPLTFICAGIGNICNDVNSCLSPRNILAYADGVVGNNLTISGWSSLADLTDTLMQQTCTSSNNIASATCQDTCCGLCVCGVCQAPDSCGTNLCETYSVGRSCCAATPISTLTACGLPAPCTLKSCNATLNNGAGGCVTAPQVCSVANTGCNGCISWGCDPLTSTCTRPDDSACQTPINCAYNDWGAWSTCTKTCGTGTTTHTRTIRSQASNCGIACDVSALTATINCATNPCPVQCVWSPWGLWSSCTASCGTGTRIQTRTITTPALNGAEPCGDTFTKTENCNTQLCPVNCAWSAWSTFSTCSVSCGLLGGTQTATRTKNPPAANGGLDCLGSSELTLPCNVGKLCPINCQYGGWGALGVCSQLCLDTTLSVPILGVAVRARVVLVVGAYGGILCDNDTLTESFSCNTNPCPIDCNYGPWSAFGACSATCGNGTRFANRSIVRPAQYGGVNCNPADNVKPESCNDKPCPIPCVYGSWADWSSNTDCSAPCEGGVQTRTRTNTPAQFDGTPCNNDPTFNSQTRPCNTQACDRPCVYNEWGAWSSCSLPCGGGVQTATRTVKNVSTGNDEPCDTSVPLSRSCNTQECPIDCVIGSWQEWAGCTATCGSGTNSRIRTNTPPQYNGAPCPTQNTNEVNCFLKECPVDCVGEWSDWSTAICDCSTRTETIYFFVNQSAKYGGLCPDANPGYQSRSDTDCTECDRDCTGQWGDWGPCACSDSQHNRTFNLVTPQKGQGLPCNPAVGTSQSDTCQPENCPVDCSGEWSSWTDTVNTTCTCNSGVGVRRTKWIITQVALNGGLQCEWTDGTINTTVTQDCSSTCPTPCEGAWSSYGECSCQTYIHSRTYHISKELTNGGDACPQADNAFEKEPCSRLDCPVNCVGAWSEWGYCNCTSNIHNRTFEVTTPAAYNGEPCAHDNNQPAEETCVKLCVDCVGAWQPWSACDCASNSTTRTYSVTQPASGLPDAGVDCPFANGQQETTFCFPPDTGINCPVDCVGQWSSYGPCECGTNRTNRTFVIIIPLNNSGTPCAHAGGFVDTPKICEPIGCPVNCVGDWSSWTTCDCDTRKEPRTYVVTQPPVNDGANCPNASGAVDYQDCNATYTDAVCPVDCVWEWGAWNNCSCSSSIQNRTVNVTTAAKNGGFACPNDTVIDYQSCEPIECPEDCVGSWSAFGDCPCTDPPTWNRTYTITKPAKWGGVECPATDGKVDVQECVSYVCPVDCVAYYTEYTDCSCTTSTWNRTYIIVNATQNAGRNCNASNNSIETSSCSPGSDCPNYGPTCLGESQNASECDDGKPCTIDACVIKADGLYHCDNTQPTVCNDNSVCTNDVCDPIAGCTFPQGLFCDDFDACTVDTCNPVSGCTYAVVTCPNISACFPGVCHPTLGCQVEELECRNASVANDTCLSYSCNPNTTSGKYCEETNTCSFPLVIVGIAAGAIAGIVCGAVICAALFSGATYAFASQTAQLGAVATTTNPLYAPSGTAGDNPMFVETPRVDAGGA